RSARRRLGDRGDVGLDALDRAFRDGRTDELQLFDTGPGQPGGTSAQQRGGDGGGRDRRQEPVENTDEHDRGGAGRERAEDGGPAEHRRGGPRGERLVGHLLPGACHLAADQVLDVLRQGPQQLTGRTVRRVGAVGRGHGGCGGPVRGGGGRVGGRTGGAVDRWSR